MKSIKLFSTIVLLITCLISKSYASNCTDYGNEGVNLYINGNKFYRNGERLFANREFDRAHDEYERAFDDYKSASEALKKSIYYCSGRAQRFPIKYHKYSMCLMHYVRGNQNLIRGLGHKEDFERIGRHSEQGGEEHEKAGSYFTKAEEQFVKAGEYCKGENKQRIKSKLRKVKDAKLNMQR